MMIKQFIIYKVSYTEHFTGNVNENLTFRRVSIPFNSIEEAESYLNVLYTDSPTEFNMYNILPCYYPVKFIQ